MLSSVARLEQISLVQERVGRVHPHIKALIPVWVESLLDDRGCSGLLSSYRSHREGIWEP